MGMLKTLVGRRVPEKYRKYLNLPARHESWKKENTADTRLGRFVSLWLRGRPEKCGVYRLDRGLDALSMRLGLIDAADICIDIQSYLIRDDLSGNLIGLRLIDAANRGVRVRLLMDDALTEEIDAGLVSINDHVNVEVRVFNPFPRSRSRFRSLIANFNILNRRMHNKSFTADNQITLIGGRNIADEYFGAREDANFGDLDVLGVGPIVQDVSNMFDAYWNHERAAPIESFADMPEDPAAELERLRAELEQSNKDILNTIYASAVEDKILESVEADSSVYTSAPYSMTVDSPDKNIKSKAATADSIVTPLLESLRAAEKELLIISPYFVPRKTGIQALSDMQNRGVKVTIITNSLAANNQASVHGGYAPSRKPLLEAGVTILEVRPDANIPGSEFMAKSGAKATLHTKAFVVDREEAFIGSFNFDPRSANINTELGVIIRSPKIAEDIVTSAEEKAPTGAYEVFINEKGKVRWRSTDDDGQEVILDKEPQTTWGQRFAAGFYRILPIRGQL